MILFCSKFNVAFKCFVTVCASIEPLDLSTSCFKGAGCNAAEFEALMPASVTTLNGSCVTVPCSFTLRDGFDALLNPECGKYWYKITYQPISSTTIRGDLTAYNCTTTFDNVHEDNVQYYFKIQCDGSPLKYNFKVKQVTIQIKGKCNVCLTETNMFLSPIGLTVVQMMLNAGNAWVSIVTALNWFGTQGSLMHLV